MADEVRLNLADAPGRRAVREIARGTGAVLRDGLKKIAVYRDTQGGPT